MLTVGVVEDHPDVREALRNALTAQDGFELLPPCRDEEEGLRLLQTHCPDVLLVDLSLPRGGDGVRVIRQAWSRWGASCVSAVLTVARHEEYWLDAIRAGAKGFVQKALSAVEWQAELRRLAAGQSPLSPDLARLLRGELRQRMPPGNADKHDLLLDFLTHVASAYQFDELAQPLQLSAEQAGVQARRAYDLCRIDPPRLSKREAELLLLLANNHSLKASADLMGVSDSTIKTYSQRLYEKLDVGNYRAALDKARELGLLS